MENNTSEPDASEPDDSEPDASEPDASVRDASDPYVTVRTARPVFIPRDGYLSPVKGLEPLNLPASVVVITHTMTEECHEPVDCLMAMKEMQRKDMNDGCKDIKYNFLVGGDGLVYEGRGWSFRPESHPWYEKYDGKAIHIAYIGNFSFKDPPYPNVVIATKTVGEGYLLHKLTRVIDLINLRKSTPEPLEFETEEEAKANLYPTVVKK